LLLPQRKNHSGEGVEMTTEQVVERAEELAGIILINPPTVVHDREFYNALLTATNELRGSINRNKLTRWLNRNKGRIVGGLRIIKEGATHGFYRWKLE
jgi:hypothetical protein